MFPTSIKPQGGTLDVFLSFLVLFCLFQVKSIKINPLSFSRPFCPFCPFCPFLVLFVLFSSFLESPLENVLFQILVWEGQKDKNISNGCPFLVFSRPFSSFLVLYSSKVFLTDVLFSSFCVLFSSFLVLFLSFLVLSVLSVISLSCLDLSCPFLVLSLSFLDSPLEIEFFKIWV